MHRTHLASVLTSNSDRDLGRPFDSRQEKHLASSLGSKPELDLEQPSETKRLQLFAHARTKIAISILLCHDRQERFSSGLWSDLDKNIDKAFQNLHTYPSHSDRDLIICGMFRRTFSRLKCPSLDHASVRTVRVSALWQDKAHLSSVTRYHRARLERQ